MNSLTGTIVAALFICSLAGPAMGAMSETTAAGAEKTGHPLTASKDEGGRVRINSFLDRFAGMDSSKTSSRKSYGAFLDIVPPISETTLFTAFTMADSPMSAYYSRLGTDSEQAIEAISRSTAFVAAPVGERFLLPEAGLAAAAIQGYFVGSGAVVGSADVAQIQAVASSPAVIIPPHDELPPGTGVPIPLPFLLAGSGLVSLLALRKRVGIE